MDGTIGIIGDDVIAGLYTLLIIYLIKRLCMKKKIIKKLITKKITISVAESCTGGLIASEIISIPNASKIFNLGLITYSNKSKEQILNIKKKKI